MMTLLYYFLYVWALMLSIPLSLVVAKLRGGLVGRLGVKGRLLAIGSKSEVIWFHVASSGEFEQCLPLLEAVKRRSSLTILLTYFSPSGKRAIELEITRRAKRQMPLPWDYADYSPWDLPWVVRPIVRALNLTAFVSIHREVWPGLLTALSKAKVPSYLLGTFWPERSQKRFSLIRPWVKLFKEVGTVDRETARFLEREVSHLKVETLGDPRIDRVLSRKVQSPVSFSKFFEKNKVFVGASLWQEDFEALKIGMDRALSAEPSLRLVLVPHDPNDGVAAQIFSFFKEKQIPIRYWSSWIESPDEFSHVIINRVGFLAELYQMAHYVFVGGSFKARVHNVLEPAVYGCPILTGPYIWNSNEAIEMSKKGGLKVCANPETVSLNLLKWVHNEPLRKSEAALNLEYIEKNKGAAERYTKLLLS